VRPPSVPAGTVLSETVFVDDVAYDPESYDPGPLARALMDAQASAGR
jgi:hypothetical protein